MGAGLDTEPVTVYDHPMSSHLSPVAPAYVQGYEKARRDLKDILFKNAHLNPAGRLSVAISWACHEPQEMRILAAGKEGK